MEFPQGHWLVCVLAMMLVELSVGLEYYEGDSCESKDIVGKCALVSNCQTHAVFIQQRLLTPKEIKSCGLSVHEEIICCPLDIEANRKRLTMGSGSSQQTFERSDEPIGDDFEPIDGIPPYQTPIENSNKRVLCNPHDKDCIVFPQDFEFKFNVGDLCTAKAYFGRCAERSRCTKLKYLFDSKKIVNEDILSCGLTVNEELVCCPDIE